MTNPINIDSLSADQIEQLQAQLAKKAEAERKAKQKEKEAYERNRDRNIKKVVDFALKISDKVKAAKQDIALMMEEQHVALTEYGGIRSNSKGGFSVTSSDGMMRITRTRDTEPFWDERGTKAVAMLKEFLEDTAKKRDQKLFEILMGFLTRNEKGDLEYAKVFHLIKHRASFDDPRWTEGLDLLQESFNINLRGYGYEISVKDTAGKWQKVNLNFTSL
jgi:DNA-binding TFAR19-related protein (PDSD5 family)